TKLNLRPSFLPFYCHAAHEHLHSFPTRRSSDLYRHYGVRPPGGRRTGEQEPQRGTDADRRVSGEESPTAQAAEAETAEAETAATGTADTETARTGSGPGTAAGTGTAGPSGTAGAPGSGDTGGVAGTPGVAGRSAAAAPGMAV